MTEEQIEKRYISDLNMPRRTIKEMLSPRQDLTFTQFKSLLTFKSVIYSKKSFNENFNLFNSNDKYNYLAFLLSDQNDTSIKVVRFEGLDKTEFISRKEFDKGCIFRQMDDAFDYSMNILNIIQTEIVDKLRVDTPYFDKESFREAWYNAVCHNLWVELTPPAIYGFEDRVEIISYGTLKEGLSKDDFYNGVSNPVNEELAKIFMQLHYMEQSGKGVPTVIRKYGRRVYKFGSSYIQCIIPFNITNKNKQLALLGKNSNISLNEDTSINSLDGTIKLSKTQKEIIEIINENLSITIIEIAEHTQYHRATISRNLNFLKEKGIIERVGSDKNGFWKILK